MQDRSGRFFGTDFSFEDLEERDTNQFEYKMAGQESIDGTLCWKIESQPKETKISQYTRSLVWIRQDNYVLVQIENFKKDQLIRRARYSDIQKLQNIWTPQTIEMLDVQRKSRTVLKIEMLQYNIPMKDEDFTIQAMQRGS